MEEERRKEEGGRRHCSSCGDSPTRPHTHTHMIFGPIAVPNLIVLGACEDGQLVQGRQVDRWEVAHGAVLVQQLEQCQGYLRCVANLAAATRIALRLVRVKRAAALQAHILEPLLERRGGWGCAGGQRSVNVIELL